MKAESLKYKENIRPLLGGLLELTGLDVNYFKGIENTLFYKNEEGKEVEVSDFLGGYGSCLFGHNHPKLKKIAIQNLEDDGAFGAQASVRGKAAELAERINHKLNSEFDKHYRTFFSNSGAEAVELALKHAAFSYQEKLKRTVLFPQIQINTIVSLSERAKSLLHIEQHENVIYSEILNKKICEHNDAIFKQKAIFMAIEGAFHGKTNAALSVTYSKQFKSGFNDLDEETLFIPMENNLRSKEIENYYHWYFHQANVNGKIRIELKKISRIACLLIEPIQGEGGINQVNKNLAAEWQQTCISLQIPLIVDEIQCGMGRTGTFLYSSKLGLRPDYLLMGKSLGGGLAKIGSCSISNQYYLHGFCMKHSSTFAEDDFCSEIAIGALDLAEDEEIISKIKIRGQFLKNALESIQIKYPEIISEIRGEGLMLGVAFNREINVASNTLYFLQETNMLGYCIAGYLLRTHRIRVAPALGKNSVLRLEPSYLVSNTEIERLAKAIEDICVILKQNSIKKLLDNLIETKYSGLNGYEIQFDRRMDKTVSDNKAAFIGHFIAPSDMALWDPFLQGLEQSDYSKLLQKISPAKAPVVYNRINVKGNNSQLELLFIGLPVCSDQMYEAMKGNKKEEMKLLIENAVDLAISEGCNVVGLGGYTSILTRNAKDLLNKKIFLTTGNSLTVGTALDALLNDAGKQDISIINSTAAVVGANGNIGQVISKLLAEKVEKLILIGRKNSTSGIVKLKEEIECDLKKRGIDIPIIEVTDDLFNLQKAQIIAAASNSPIPLIFPEMLGNKPTVICDISVPGDVDISVVSMKHNVRIIRGGIISSEKNKNFYIPGIPLEKGNLFACMSETILMGLEGLSKHFSIGEITVEQVKEIQKIAVKHGFILATSKVASSY